MRLKIFPNIRQLGDSGDWKRHGAKQLRLLLQNTWWEMERIFTAQLEYELKLSDVKLGCLTAEGMWIIQLWH